MIKFLDIKLEKLHQNGLNADVNFPKLNQKRFNRGPLTLCIFLHETLTLAGTGDITSYELLMSNF